MTYSIIERNQMRVLLLNDTYNWYHWGCTATSNSIREGIVSRGYDLNVVPIYKLTEIENYPKSKLDFLSDSWYNTFCNENQVLIEQIEQAQLIVINGEGSIHGIRKISLLLLYLAFVAKTKFNKKVNIINHSVYPLTDGQVDDEIANDLYRLVYTKIDYIAIREPVSLSTMRKIGIEAVQSFDSLPLYINNHFKKSKSRESKSIVLTGSVDINKYSLDNQVEFIKYLISKGFNVTYLTGAKRHPAKSDYKFIDQLQVKLPNLNVVDAQSLDEWLNVIGTARLLVSGRFHHLIAAISLGTPFVSMNSNTKKIEGVMELISEPLPIKYDSDNFLRELISRTKYTLAQKDLSEEYVKKRFLALTKLAEKNFNGL